MEKPTGAGADKKPQRANTRPAGTTRTPPAGKPSTPPVGKPSEPAARPARPAAKPAGTPAGNPAAKPVRNPAAKPAVNPAAKPAVKPAGNAAKPAGNAVKPAGNAAKPAGNAKPPGTAPKPAGKRPVPAKSGQERPTAPAVVDDSAVIEPVLGTQTERPEQPELVPPKAAEGPGPSTEAGATAEPRSEALASAGDALARVAGTVLRVSTATWARIGALARRSAATIRRSAAAAAERAATARAAARDRAAAARVARDERVESRALARLERAGAGPHLVQASVDFEFAPVIDPSEYVLAVTGLTKRFDDTLAVDGLDLRVRPGAFYGIVGPNGAGKTTTLSMITGLLRPDAGSVVVHGKDVWSDAIAAKRDMGVLPDRLRLFDRLTGAQLLHYAGVLRGLDVPTVKRRSADLAYALGLEESLARLVSDYSVGMTKKIALASALIHAPRLLVLDEPFESVDPVSAANLTSILKQYAAAGGTVLLSSHSMDLVQRVCDSVAVIVGGVVLADGAMDDVRDGLSLEERFVALAGARNGLESPEWLYSFSD